MWLSGSWRVWNRAKVGSSFLVRPIPAPPRLPLWKTIYVIKWISKKAKNRLFLDQKYNRLAVSKLAQGKRVLDCFTHTGSFALNAAKGGAEHVTAVDVSASAIEMAQKNAEQNGLAARMDFITENVFDLLPRLEAERAKYDFIILDPPAFTKSRKTMLNAMGGYRAINARAMRILPRGGYLATCSCSHFASEEMFQKCCGMRQRMPAFLSDKLRCASRGRIIPSSGAWKRPTTSSSIYFKSANAYSC